MRSQRRTTDNEPRTTNDGPRITDRRPRTNMARLLVVGGGLFGSQAAAYARGKGIDAIVFDAGLHGAASAAAAGLFQEAWAGKKYADHFRQACPVLDRLYGIRHVTLVGDDEREEDFFFVPPSVILEAAPLRQEVTAIGDGWLETDGMRYEGWVYVAAGIWCERFLPGLGVYGKAGAAFSFEGERAGRIRELSRSRQALCFVRDPGRTHFSDGTAERDYTPEHDRQTLSRAAALGLTDPPVQRSFGYRPYTPGGPKFLKL